MYPPVETPTSPDDHNMIILDGLQKIPTPEQIPKMLRNPLSGGTAKEMELKRASLKLDGCTKALDDNDLLLRNKRYSLNDRDLIMALSKRKSNTNTTILATAGAGDLSPELDNRTTSGSVQSAKDENENYCDGGKEIDNKNGNGRIMDCGQPSLVRVPRNDNSNDVDRNIIMEEKAREAEDDRNGNMNRNSATTCDENEEDEPYHRLIPEEEDADSDSKGSGGLASNSSSCCLSSGGGVVVDGVPHEGVEEEEEEEECLKETRNSMASSSDESVELREKLDQDELQDEFDEQRQLLFGHHNQQRHSRRLMDNQCATSDAAATSAEEPMDILSPNEGPLARRYAEIAQFSGGKW